MVNFAYLWYIFKVFVSVFEVGYLYIPIRKKEKRGKNDESNNKLCNARQIASFFFLSLLLHWTTVHNRIIRTNHRRHRSNTYIFILRLIGFINYHLLTILQPIAIVCFSCCSCSFVLYLFFSSSNTWNAPEVHKQSDKHMWR